MKKEIEETEIKCETCGCDVDGHSHTCPFAEELYDDDRECTCCEACTCQCLMDI